MTIRTVGPSSDYATIAAAMNAAGPGDTIFLQAGYSNETAAVDFSGMTIYGDASSHGIVLHLGAAVATVSMTGLAPFDLHDAADGNGIIGNAGSNHITVSGGVDAVDGGLGVDRLIVDYRHATGAVTGDSTSHVSEAGGGGRSVTITSGTFEHFTILTGSGADTITTGAGNDVIKTGSGASTVSAGQGANFISGGENSDTITALDGGNRIYAGDGANTVTTGGGRDMISTGRGADTIVAGGGVDNIYLRGGADTVDAGAGHDRLHINYAAMASNVTGGITGGVLAGGYVGHIADSLGNSINFRSAESFTVTTGAGNDTIITGSGADVLRGGNGNDHFSGGKGADQLFGDAGDDRLRGGLGNDVMTGGSGADVFVFGTIRETGVLGGHDMIRDFEVGSDHIGLVSIDANWNTSGNQAFHFIGSAGFTSAAGQLRFADGLITGDVDGDGQSDFTIELGAVLGLSGDDFWL